MITHDEQLDHNVRPGWPLELAPGDDARLDQLAALARQFTESTSTEARAQVRELLDEAVQLNTRALAGVTALPPDSRRRIRAAGAAIAGGRLATDVVIAQLGRLTSCALLVAVQRGDDPAPLVVTGNQIVQDFLAGVGEAGEPAGASWQTAHSPADLVRRLVVDGTVPDGAEPHLAPAYVVVVLNFVKDVTPNLAEVLEQFGPGVLVAQESAGAVALLPAVGRLDEKWVVERLDAGLAGQAWGAVATRDRLELPAGHDEAVRVLGLAHATHAAPGLYRRADFPLEFAVAQHDDVAEDLVEVITPVMTSTVLRVTLEALIRADFNRSRAAKALFVHRSTMDYRMRRIEEITGCNPAAGRGSQVLNVAVTMYLLREPG